jgi:hypothetical protein
MEDHREHLNPKGLTSKYLALLVSWQLNTALLLGSNAIVKASGLPYNNGALGKRKR